MLGRRPNTGLAIRGTLGSGLGILHRSTRRGVGARVAISGASVCCGLGLVERPRRDGAGVHQEGFNGSLVIPSVAGEVADCLGGAFGISVDTVAQGSYVVCV